MLTYDSIYKELDFETDRVPVNGVRNERMWNMPNDVIMRIDEDIPQPLAIVSSKYELVPHTDVLSSFNGLVDGLGENSIKDFYMTEHGARFSMCVEFPEHKIKIDEGDECNLQLHLHNSYDGSRAFQINFGAFRLVCSNGMVIGDNMYSFKHRHTKGLDVNKTKDVFLNTASIKTKSLEKLFIGLRESELSSVGVEDLFGLISKTIPKKHVAAARAIYHNPIRSLDGQDNLWGVYNAFTDYFTHNKSSSNGRNEDLSMKVFDIISKAA